MVRLAGCVLDEAAHSHPIGAEGLEAAHVHAGSGVAVAPGEWAPWWDAHALDMTSVSRRKSFAGFHNELIERAAGDGAELQDDRDASRGQLPFGDGERR